MKKMKITLAERIAALVVAIALLAGMAPDALLRVSAETENHEGMYTLAVCDAQGEPLAGAEISWVICDEAGNNEAEQEKKTSGEDGVCELGEISTALGETEAGVEKVYYKITGINKFGYIYSTAESQNIYEVEKADRNSHREIRLTEKEKGTLTGKIETTEGAALEHAEILIEPGAKTAQTDAEGKYTVEGLYVGETYQVSVSHDDYISPEPKSVTYAVDAACDFNMAAKTGDDSFVFTQTSPDALTYAEELKYTNLISGAAEGIKYVIEEEKNADGEAVETAGTVAEINAATGELSVKTAGSVTVKATDSRYVAFYTLTINRAAQPDIAFDENCPESLDKGLSYNMTSWITGGVETADVVYTIDPAYSEVAVVENGMLAAKGVGTFMLTAQRGKTDCYKESNAVSCEIKVELPSQKEIEISGIEDTITYSPSRLEGPITVQNKDGSAMEEKVEITYEIKSADNSETAETDVAEFVGEDGSVLGDGRSVTITGNNGVYIKTKKAGKFMLCVTKKVEDHKDVAVSKEIVVKRADRSYTWIDKLNITYGAASCELDKVKDDQNNAVEDGVTYTIEENDLGATIKDGVVYFSDEKTGTATITATAEKTDAYNEWKAECQLTVSWLDTPESTYILQADKVVLGEETWYKAKSDTGEVTLSAPEGYQISSEYKLAEDGWKDYIVYDSGLKNIYLRNKAGGITDAIEITEKIDIRAPENLSISYESENGTDFYHKNNVSVTLVAKDSGSGIESFVYRLDTGEEKTIKSPDIQFNDDTASYTFRIPAQYAGKISFKAVDRVGNSDNYITEDDLIVDNLAPEVDITYSKNGLKLVDAQNNVVEHVGADTRFIYNQAVTAKITIKENNFDEKKVKLKINGVDSKIEWKAQGVEKEYVGIFELNQDGTYKVTFECEDKSGNTMKWKSDETDGDYAEGTYTSHEIVVDTKKPEIAVAYDDKIKPVKSSCYDTARTATITITEANFDASKVNVAIAAKNISGKAVSKENEASISSWETDKTDASIHTATVTFPGNAVYTLDISGEDIAGNKSNPYGQDKFTVDHSAPKTSDMKITYDKELKSWEKVVNKVTFGYYAYRKGVTVTLTAKDDISGIDKMKWTYLQEDGSSTDKNVKKKEGTISGSSITYSSDGITATASFKLTASEAKQFRGTVSFTATDRAGNTSKLKQDGKRVNVVDTITPKRTVSFTPAKQIVNGKMYYDGPVTAAFQITEANFYSKDVVIRVNGKKKTPKNWKQDGDTWTGSIKISGDGEYVVTATYKDRSGNRMKKYTSKKIVIDTKDPVIKVAYGNKDSKNTEGGTKYFDDVQTASITIREKNFRAKDVKVKVTAKDINGKDVSVMNYASYLSNKKNWKKNGDTYTAQISFTEDANYTFDIECQDLAKRAAADYKPDSFTVDRTAPGNLTVSYSNSIVEKVLNALTFGYYNAPMTVTVSAEDETSGVEHFTYSYRKDSGVSSVNAELIDAAIQKANIVQNGNTFTASFRIPQQALENLNQFNGTVDFCAYDQAANSSAKADDKRIVVDNIKPTADVTFSDPVREAGNISYYAGDILATVVIHEANFDASDVAVSVTRDGAPAAVTPVWQDDGVDTHTGTFTLQEDGDYIVSVSYTDASSNEMEPYTSNQLTIDTTAPTVSVSNVKMNSANKDEVYGFTITASDTNFDMANFKPVLTALIQNAQGKYVTETIDLGTMRTSEAGSTYSYSVSNLDADAVYKLVCTVSDMAGNEYSRILLNEDHEEYETVRFSINRNGSAYAVDEAVETLVEQYYVYGVTDDIQIEETNVDPIEAYTVKMNGESLTEGSDYTTTLTANEGEWCKRTYTIKKELFDAEGEYNVVVESTDKTNTTAYSDVKNLNVSFVVDQTPPVLTVSGLAENGRYQVQEQTVTVIPTDDGGKLESFQAVVLDADGNLSRDENGEDNSVRFDMSGEEFEEYLKENNGTVTFTIPEGLEQQVLLVCNDMSLHTDGTTNECNEKFTKVTVSQSGWVIFYANKPLLYSMIAGIVLLIAAAGGIIVLVRRKNKRV